RWNLDGDSVGWCAVEPRTSYVRLLRTRVPWAGRAEDKTDDGIWAVTYSPARVSGAVASAVRSRASPVDFARHWGAPALEGYPMITPSLAGDHLGRAPCRQPQHLRRHPIRRVQPADLVGHVAEHRRKHLECVLRQST